MGAAFAYERLGRQSEGNTVTTWGTFTPSGGATGGDIDTELKVVREIQFQYGGSAAVADAVVVNETLPCDGSAVTIVTTADKTGYWCAKGHY